MRTFITVIFNLKIAVFNWNFSARQKIVIIESFHFKLTITRDGAYFFFSLFETLNKKTGTSYVKDLSFNLLKNSNQIQL